MYLKTAILQMRSEDRNIEKNIGTVISNMELAAGEKADILLLPECFITGYQLPIENEAAVAERFTPVTLRMRNVWRVAADFRSVIFMELK